MSDLTDMECDDTRPCQLCIRSKAECIEATEKTRRSNRKHQLRRPQPPSNDFNYVQHHAAGNLYRPSMNDHAAGTSHQLSPTEVPSHGQERSSTFGLAEKLFKDQSSRPGRSDALPGGSPSDQRDLPQLFPVNAIIGTNLPPATVAHLLLNTYLETFHWYITLFHEPGFRRELDVILSSGLAQKSQKSFLLLVLAVMLQSIDLCKREQLYRAFPTLDPEQARASWRRAIEANMLTCFDNLEVAFLGCLFVMTTVYLQDKKTPLALSIVAMMVRAAQSMDLHKESSWSNIDEDERQVRRMVWWSIFMSDGYSSQAYGKPSLLHECDFRVSLPENHGDISPVDSEIPPRQVERIRSADSLSYNRHKAELYLITAPLTHDMYFKTSSSSSSGLDQTNEIHQRLLLWERELPTKLQPQTYANEGSDVSSNGTVRAFALQAFTLQAAYENMQLLLHRPFISVASESAHRGFHERTTVSRDQCYVSAMRMTDVHIIPGIVQILEATQPYTQWVSYVFNGGVMLAMLALSNITSERTPLCKQALARLIKALQSGTRRLAMCEQVCHILTRLMHLIAAEEVKSMLDEASPIGPHEDTSIPEYGSPVLPVSRGRRRSDQLATESRLHPTPAHQFTSGDGSTDGAPSFNLEGEFGLDGIGHLWLWNDSFSLP